MRIVYGGPFDGSVAEDADSDVVWLDELGRAHAGPGAGRARYRYAFGCWLYEPRPEVVEGGAGAAT